MNNARVFNTVGQVGNYTEMWDRNLAPLGLDRGASRPASQGGLMFAPPLR